MSCETVLSAQPLSSGPWLWCWASEATVKTLVPSHFVTGGPVVDAATGLAAVRPHFAGAILMGQDSGQARSLRTAP
jgi:hypothetical protein